MRFVDTGLLSPQASPFAEADFHKHMLEDLLIEMIASIGLVMGASISLLSGILPSRYGRIVTRFVGNSWLQIVANPVVALILDPGGMAVLYFTPLYIAMMMRPALYYLVHFHFVASGCFYTWAIAGPDPAPHRRSALPDYLSSG